MEAWHGTLGLLDTPTEDGRFLLKPPQLAHRELPLPLHIASTTYNAQVGVITVVTMSTTRLTGSGFLDLRLLTLISTPLADSLTNGDSIGIGLDIAQLPVADAASFTDGKDPATLHDWHVKGAHLVDLPAWPQARITLLAQPEPISARS